MTKVASIGTRKDDHIHINLEQNVGSSLETGLSRIHLIHEALPELNLDEIDTKTTLFNKTIQAPILVSSMTGGTSRAGEINFRLAAAAQECGLAMGLGSQRAGLEHPEQVASFQVRKVAPNILLFGNIGAIQLNYGYGVDECRRVVDMVEADALYLHLNPLQEAVQAGGDTQWKGLAVKIEHLCKKLEVPVIAKEVGWGISAKTARMLLDCGISAIDVAGAGGTSWSQVEMYRAPDEFTRKLAGSFVEWGIPTVDSILNVKAAAPDVTIFASGGLKDGLDIAKCIALGAALGGMAGPFLKAAAISEQAVVDFMKLIHRQLAISMFASGAGNISELQNNKIWQE